MWILIFNRCNSFNFACWKMPLDFPWPFYPSDDIPIHWKIASQLTIGAVGTISKIGLKYLNTLTVTDINRIFDAFEQRPSNQGLITVSNHHSCLDDPALWGMMKWRHLLLNANKMRWGLGAHDICFKNKYHTKFFSLGKVIPTVRGDGVYQPAMDFAIEQLNRGGWVHVFPEGRVNMDKTPYRFKWGVGRLIAESEVTPVVLPFCHIGMDDMLPNYVYVPRVMKNITVVFGEPIDFTETIKMLKAKNSTPEQMRKHITDIIQERLHALEEKANEIHIQNYGVQNKDRKKKESQDIFEKSSLNAEK